MDAELTQLEHQVEQLIALYERLKADNRGLLERVARLETENRGLSDKVRLATTKLEALLQKLPEV